MENKKCLICNNIMEQEKYIAPSVFKKRRFCSTRCSAIWRNIHFPVKTITYDYTCKYCNIHFTDNNKNRVFCSKECLRKWQKINYLGEKNHFYGKTHSKKVRNIISDNQFKTPITERNLNNCIICNEVITKSEDESWKSYKAHKFCSKLCFSKFYKGENCNFWKGGIFEDSYPKDFSNLLKKSIRKRDNQICMNCGIHMEKLNKALDIHHINYDKNLNIPENLISLCHKCHVLTNSNREYWKGLLQEKLSKLHNYKYLNGEIVLNMECKEEK